MIYRGNIPINMMMAGDKRVATAYLGDNLVYRAFGDIDVRDDGTWYGTDTNGAYILCPYLRCGHLPLQEQYRCYVTNQPGFANCNNCLYYQYNKCGYMSGGSLGASIIATKQNGLTYMIALYGAGNYKHWAWTVSIRPLDGTDSDFIDIESGEQFNNTQLRFEHGFQYTFALAVPHVVCVSIKGDDPIMAGSTPLSPPETHYTYCMIVNIP